MIHSIHTADFTSERWLLSDRRGRSKHQPDTRVNSASFWLLC